MLQYPERSQSDEYPRLSRLLGLVELLKGVRERSVQEIADTLGISRRTVFRDLSTLQASGVPLQKNPHTKSYSLPKGISSNAKLGNLGAIWIALALSNANTPPLKRAIAMLETEIVNRFDRQVSARIQSALGWIEVEENKEDDDQEQQKHLETVFNAYYQSRKVRICYSSSTSETFSTLLTPVKLYINSSVKPEKIIVGHSSYHCCSVGVPLKRIRSTTETEDTFEKEAFRTSSWLDI
ncbi:MAG TPA: HTH domain-containing protein [Planctomicrobium sp.]|nr:HTH domain-containing protein [Planctomicrobium sp.]